MVYSHYSRLSLRDRLLVKFIGIAWISLSQHAVLVVPGASARDKILNAFHDPIRWSL